MTIERTFRALDRYGVEQEFELIEPSSIAEHEGERQYRIAFSRALRDGILPREKLREIMREHDIWSPTDDQDFKRIVAKIALLQVELKRSEATGDRAQCLELAKEMNQTRKKMWELFLVQQSVFTNSAEGVAEVIKLDAIMSCCVMLKGSKKRYWKDYTEYVMERDFNEKSSVYIKAAEIQTHILEEVHKGLLENYPENNYAKEIQAAVLDPQIKEEVTNLIKKRVEDAKDGKKPKTRVSRK